MSEVWNNVGVESEGKSSVVLFTPSALPAAIKSRKVSLELEPGTTITDLVAVLGKIGVTVILSDESVGKKSFYMPRYNGSLGNLLAAVSRATNVWFTWHDGAIHVSATERIGVSIPQESNFGEELGKGLETLGVKDRSVNWKSGMATLEITPNQFHKVKSFIERYTANAAVISLQVAVINVTLNQTAKQGIDWDKLQLSAVPGGDLAKVRAYQSLYNNATNTAGNLVNGVNNMVNAPVDGTTGMGTGTGTGTTTTPTTGSTTSTPPTGAAAALTWAGNALSGAIFTNRFSFQGLFNFLQSYGVAETKQNVLLKTAAGNKVEFKSLTQIPYVSEIGATTTGTTNNNGGNNVVGSSKTAKADDGLTVEMSPSFDAAANTVTVEMKLSIKAVVAFNELSAGNQLGKLTQPTTAERSMTDTVRLRPGQTVVVGGLTYDSVSDNKGAPIFLTGTKLESQSLTVNRQSMFIVLRPTVQKLGQVLSQESGESLDLMPAGAYVPEPSDEPKASKKKGAK